MDANLTQRDIKAIQRHDKDFSGTVLMPSLYSEYPQHYRYILVIKSKIHTSGYPNLKAIGKGLDHKFYYAQVYDYIDFDNGIKLDNFGHITRVQANASSKNVKGEMGIFKFYLHNIIACTIKRENK